MFWALFMVPGVLWAQDCIFENQITESFLLDCPDHDNTCLVGGESIELEVVIGNVYTFTTCGDVMFDSQITVFADDQTTILAFNDDDCFLQSTVTWVADFSGIIYAQINQYPCDVSIECIEFDFECNPYEFAGCPNENILVDIITPVCPGEYIIPCLYGGEGVFIDVVQGNTYSFYTCGVNDFNTVLTLYNQSGFTLIDFNDDFCGLQSSITWTADYTGQVQLLLNESPCNPTAVCTQVVVVCDSQAPVGCGNDNVIIDHLTPDCPSTTTVDCITGGQSILLDVESGNTYTISTCGNTDFNTVITVYDETGSLILDFNDDFCGTQSQVAYTATFTGTILILIDEAPCADNTICTPLTIECDNGCNTNTILCQNTAGPFNFGPIGEQVSSCQNLYFNSQFAYILVNISTTGPLSLLIEGNSTLGFLDVSVFNIPNGVPPCEAVQDIANEIGCNYADFSSGCNQFGNAFPCPSTVPSPIVTAGQTIMIIVEDWLNGPSDNFNLQLGPLPNAQSGPANPTIIDPAPLCFNSTPIQIVAVDAGGTWTGTGVTAEGVFDPQASGIGTFPISYSIGQSPCNATDQSAVLVVESPNAQIIASDTSICAGEQVTLTGQGGGTYAWNTGQAASSILVQPATTTTYSVTVTLGSGCIASTNQTILVTPPPTPSPIFHN